jgi:hypothetical protein
MGICSSTPLPVLPKSQYINRAPTPAEIAGVVRVIQLESEFVARESLKNSILYRIAPLAAENKALALAKRTVLKRIPEWFPVEEIPPILKMTMERVKAYAACMGPQQDAEPDVDATTAANAPPPTATTAAGGGAAAAPSTP